MSDSKKQPNTIHFIALGCAKNRVDTEVMAGFADKAGLQITGDPETADIIVVNTCGFIESAKKESIDMLLEAGRIRRDGKCSLLVAAGCLSQRYGRDLHENMTEVDHFIGTGDLTALKKILDGENTRFVQSPAGHYLQSAVDPRYTEPGAVSAYIKIGDGCSRRCAFCAIPAIRGKAASRSIDDIAAEARLLTSRGIRELNLVAQDTSAYGVDRDDGANLVELLKALDRIDGICWVRLLYLYPDAVTDELIQTVSNLKSTVPYLDIPIQHASRSMLKKMRRGHGPEVLTDLFERIRKQAPEAFLRTTVLVGHPGETAEDIETLTELMKRVGFNHLGAFRYSDEEGTPSFDSPLAVSARDSYNRHRKVLATQRKISRTNNRAMKGRIVQVLVEDTADDRGYVLQGRHMGQAPEIDGVTLLVSSDANIGDIVTARIIDFEDHDLVAEPV